MGLCGTRPRPELLGASRPKITVPAVTLDGVSDTLKPGGTQTRPVCSPPAISTA
jgi:hypothetical protein